ncbi:MAG TPA: methylated-DNA--[protein]-cysteine S-methyltransferase [Fimbriimonadaceae bacterium]|nr:methylated-DNA--[protein]-cysteine S-methyltransferase [Fimbriimonadaceae bacterium]
MKYFCTMPSPIGPLRPIVDERGAVVRIAFPDENVTDAVEDPKRVAGVVAQLEEYFDGKRRAFDLELRPEGSEFQHQVWKLVYAIPFGQTRSYGQLAAEMKLASGARAIGRANATNPIPIVVPCHRVIGANGSLTGYAGGLEVKRMLLELEQPTLF